MRFHREFLFAPSAVGSAVINAVENGTVHAMPAVDANNVDTTVANNSGNAVLVKFAAGEIDGAGTGTLKISPRETVLLRSGDNGFGDAAKDATEITVAGRATVTVCRGTATLQQIFADR